MEVVFLTEEFRFLPMNKEEMRLKSWNFLDIIIVTGDAYIDHSSFGAAIIGRVLENQGYKVGIIAQPQSRNEYMKLGKPKLFFGITAGNMDTLVSNYTPLKRRRDQDAYSPSGKPGLRPDRATIVYTNKIKGIFKDSITIIGGIEASLRRFAHYDYLSNKIRRSILFDSKADLLVYGMGEKPITEIANLLKAGIEIDEIRDVRGTCIKKRELTPETIKMPSFSEVKNNKDKFIEAFLKIRANSNPYNAKPLAQSQNGLYLYQNPPLLPLTSNELDAIYELPYQFKPHPSYKKEIPAFNTVKNSIVTHRGCFGACNFCAIYAHQGSVIQDRSIDSILQEIERISKLETFHGVISDLGGPSAGMYGMNCGIGKYCPEKSCLTPEICPHLKADFSKFRKLLEKARNLPFIKHVFVRSGFRFDLLLEDIELLEELMRHHISGQLKVAPEHIIDTTLKYMNKSTSEKFKKFVRVFKRLNKDTRRKLFIIPYWLAGHPGTTLSDQIELARYLKLSHLYIKQTQLFIPTPMSASTCMFWTGKDPFTEEGVYVPYSYSEKKMQKALLHFKDPKQHQKIRKALKICNREDLIGNKKDSLVP
ncbi:MAG: YgiQ family radical SAM protein [Candidatus Lokiarchaeota archaeon]|nr:YgiQ family radical SAM protein [Candidatus Lokiarchaeota archaeon]